MADSSEDGEWVSLPSPGVCGASDGFDLSSAGKVVAGVMDYLAVEIPFASRMEGKELRLTTGRERILSRFADRFGVEDSNGEAPTRWTACAVGQSLADVGLDFQVFGGDDEAWPDALTASLKRGFPGIALLSNEDDSVVWAAINGIDVLEVQVYEGSERARGCCWSRAGFERRLTLIFCPLAVYGDEDPCLWLDESDPVLSSAQIAEMVAASFRPPPGSGFWIRAPFNE